jgi:tellurite resistance-related uncharacterized protein
MQDLPADTTPYKRTPTFTQDTVPQGLLSEHQTKAGTWGLLTVESGSLTYVITEPGEEEEIVVAPSRLAVIAPQQRHHVRITGTVAFHVQFLR